MVGNQEGAGVGRQPEADASDVSVVEALIAASSLGTPGAVELRRRAVADLGEEGLRALVARIHTDNQAAAEASPLPDPGPAGPR
ncbi:MAG TPA: hypothetical protein VL737_00510 [Candidatus Pristimantibacillus sp.]|jgi:hypothetical protein|nr:hypothetical protein [Candidatus Pristimantibacillus sp.]